MTPLTLLHPRPETPADRATRLQSEARSAAMEQIEGVQAAMQLLLDTAAPVSTGGDAYPPGARDLCRHIVAEMAFKARTLEAIMGRVG